MKTTATIEHPFWRIHTEAFLKEIINNNPSLGILNKPMEIFGLLLFAVADRARELNDPELNSLMCRLTLYMESDPNSPEYTSEKVNELLSRFDKNLQKRLKKS